MVVRVHPAVPTIMRKLRISQHGQLWYGDLLVNGPGVYDPRSFLTHKGASLDPFYGIVFMPDEVVGLQRSRLDREAWIDFGYFTILTFHKVKFMMKRQR